MYSKNTVYVLNSPILTDYGKWVFEGPISIVRAKKLLSDGFTSAIGHQVAANFLSNLLGIVVPMNRVRIQMEPGNRALVVRILERMPEGKVLSHEEMKRVKYELGLLQRVS